MSDPTPTPTGDIDTVAAVVAPGHVEVTQEVADFWGPEFLSELGRRDPRV